MENKYNIACRRLYENISLGYIISRDSRAIYRIQRKLYTSDVSNALYNSNADFSFVPLYEVEASAQEGRSPYTYYYDYSFNSTYLSFADHSNNTLSMPFDNNIYDSSWSLATFRTQTETDIVSEKLKLDAINNTDISENSDYYIGGKMEIRPNADTSFKHIYCIVGMLSERETTIFG